MNSPTVSRVAALLSGRPYGFTLLSQLAALGIVGILFAIALGSYTDLMPRVRLEGAARQIVSDLMFARMKAVRERRRHRIGFQTPESYEVLSEEEDGTWLPVLARNLSSDYPGVHVSVNNDPVFAAGGRASVLATIRVFNEAGERRLSVNITGRVKME